MKMKKVSNILFKIELEGNGIVNNDSVDQKWIFSGENSEKTNHLKSRHNNVTYAKKNFYRDENNNLDYKIKISSDALRNSMFRNDLVAQTPSIMHHDALLHSFIATPIGLIRGYMFASIKETFKRKSPLTITDAEQTTTNKSCLETYSRSGGKDIHEDKEGSDTSFFKQETIGDVLYSAKGSINLIDLQFVGCDSIFDRVGFNPDLYELMYKPHAKLSIPNFSGELNYFNLSSSIIDMPEYGLKISSENTLFLVKETLKRLFGIDISKAGSYAKIKSLSIKLVKEPLIDRFSKDDGWLRITSIDDIENLSFDIVDAYILADETKAKKIRIDIEAAYQEEQDKKKNKKEDAKIKKAANIKTKKEAKTNE